MLPVLWRGILGTALAVLAIPAQAASVRELFEQHKLLGTFAIDCTRPISPQNYNVIYRAIDGGRVSIELMVGPNKLQYSYIIDHAEMRGFDGLAVSMANDQRRLNLVYRVDGKRLRTFESAPASGPPIIAGGVFVSDKTPTPWLTKCR